MSYRTNLLEYFEELMAKGKDNDIAVVDGQRTLTFKELYTQSKQLALYIQNITNDQCNTVIGVLFNKSIESVVADLAILFSGNSYLNLDPKNPVARLNGIADHCKLKIIFSECKSKLTFADSVKVLHPFEDHSIFADSSVYGNDLSSENLHYKKLIDTDPLCVINTSGSTGIPKAVMLSHRGMIDFIEAVKKQDMLSEAETIGSLSPAFFDIYSFELCMMIVWGSKLVIIPETYAVFPLKILELLKQESVSYIFWVPTIMVNIANSDLLSLVNLPSLKKVWFAGEVFPTSKFKYWAERLPNAEFINMYGPIEIHVDCLCYKVPHDIPAETPIPIGKPFFNTSVLLITDEMKQAKVGEEGEICIRGSSLAHGYYNDEEKTANAFTQNPLNHSYPERIYRTGDLARIDDNGNYIFLGRKDTLIKRMGYRIELSEIEHIAVDSIRFIKNCCVIYKASTKDLIMFYEAQEEISVAEIKKEMLKHLPRYMVPTVFTYLQEMPRNPNGKIDRKKLKDTVLNEN